MDGISLTAQVKEHFPNIHIIVLSSYDNFAYAKSSFKLGIADYLLKPELEAADLLHLLEKLSRTSGLVISKVPPLSFSKKFLHSAAWRRRNIWWNLRTEVSILKKKYHIR